MTTLISFLGKNRRDPATGYQRARYCFDDGQTVQTAFFGSALMQHLRPDRTLLLGTAGSMWDALDIDTDAPEWPELIEASERSDVDQALLDRVSMRARASMAGAELVLMPYARSESEQTGLLADLATTASEARAIITPMLAEIDQLGGATRLFAGQLAQRLAWARPAQLANP